MTVHKAKGLEFPVVILADLTCKLARAEAGRWLDPANDRCALKLGGWAPIDLLLHDAEEAARDRAEVRAAHLRGRDAGEGPARRAGDRRWSLRRRLARSADAGDLSAGGVAPRSAAGPGVPLFASRDSVLARPDGDPATNRTVAPGTFTLGSAPSTEQRAASSEHRAPSTEHRAPSTEHPAPSTYAVTWWDPRALALGAESTFGLRRDDLIVKDGDMFAVEDRLAAYEQWRDARAALVAAAARPTLPVQTATAWAADAAQTGVADLLAGEVEVISMPGAAGRPRGPRFGTLVHAVLASVPFEADPSAIERTARAYGRLLKDVTSEEVAAAAAVAAAVLEHDVWRRARASASVRRETPVSWVLGDGMLIEGVLDLAFEENGRTVVVDFKTDHELAAGETRYRAQLQQYVGAVARATGRPASGVLFKI